MGKNTKLENFVYISNVFICIIKRILQYVSILHNFGYILVFYYWFYANNINDNDEWLGRLIDWLIDWLISEPWF